MCLQGDAAAICNLGVCYYHGTAVTKDIDKALSLWRDAAKMGNSAAHHNLERCRKRKISCKTEEEDEDDDDDDEDDDDEEDDDDDGEEEVLLIANLSRLLSPIQERKSVLETRLFKGPIVNLEPGDQVKRRKYVIDALKATVCKIQNELRDEAKRRQNSGAKMEHLLQQLLKSCDTLITLIEERQVDVQIMESDEDAVEESANKIFSIIKIISR